MSLNSAYILRTLAAAIIVSFTVLQTHARIEHTSNPADNYKFFQDTSKYPLKDRRGDPYTYPGRNAFDLSDTSFIKRNIEYDPVTKQYFIVEKIGNRYYRTPMTFSMKEFIELQGRKDEQEYFRKRANLLTSLNRRNVKPNFGFSPDWMNRITGNGKVEIRPTGYVDIAAGYQGQNIKNPTLPERARKTGGFDFNMNAQLQVDANIGDKIKLPINYNTLANFDFENQLKLDYQGRDDEILKQFQAGNVSFSSKGTLIPGAQSLFGIKTQLQFGRLFVSTVLANQRAQRQSLGLQGGSATQTFSLRADEYEENRHFLMSQYFRRNYNKAMSNLPVVNSNVQVLRVEVWVTNRTGITTDTRDIVALMDLGEGDPFFAPTGNPNILPGNDANNLYRSILQNPGSRNSTQVQSVLSAMGLQPVQDFEKTFARKLQQGDYYFNPQIGFLSLNQQLQPDEVLGVAYQYTYNGKVFQVGEFSQDVPPDSTGNTQNVLFLKLLKATSQRPNLPIWDLMMKNVYSVGFGQLERQDFKLDIVYEEPSLGEKRYLPISDSLFPQFKGVPILSLVNLDRLNNQNDPQPDGVFDYIEGFTVISSQSRIIFPLLEPFGRDLEYVYANPGGREKYLYYPLYDTIKAIAQTFAHLNRFELVGRSRSASNADYQLGFNIPRGSVTVTAGGQILRENIDYEINYDLGTLRVINAAIINAGLPVQVQYENNAAFGMQPRNYMGLRLDYLLNRNLTLGATIVRLGEQPFFTKQSYGEDPIRNTMYGVDFDYRKDVPRISKWLDKLPFYSTRAISSIAAYGEAAMLQPGHSPLIGKGGEGVVYVDDFEGTRSSIDLRFPLINWTLSSTPQRAIDKNGNILFPEAELYRNLEYGFNRAKLAWYNIEPVLQERRNSNNPIRDNLTELSKPETRQVFQEEIFPQRTADIGQGLLTTFDVAFYPHEKGPYNFATDRINANGRFLQPRKAWGGIMRNIDQTDFETSNIEFIEFWMQDPFIRKPNSSGGELYFNLGNISEDVLRDGKRLYENGLPAPSSPSLPVDTTIWGRVPRNPIQVTNAFSNDPADRPFQDVGFDGLPDSLEKAKFQPYLNQLQTTFGTGAPVYQKAVADPSADNFLGYRNEFYDQRGAGILERYKDINNPHGNSPIAGSDDQFSNAFTLYPDQEELNRDNTLNEVEEYFQYRVEMKPNMQVGANFITDKRTVSVNLADGSRRSETWYLFRIPVKEYQVKVGNIPDFKSVRFIRMFLTSFEDTAVLRFGKLELVRNQWRKFNYETDTTGNYKPLPANDPTTVDVLAVNLEENDQRQPVPYRQPPGIERQEQISNNNIQLLQNEQSLSLKICNIVQGQARGVFKTMNLDLRQYGRLSMFIHAESVRGYQQLEYGDLDAVIRIGNDFVSNYYEVRIPLKFTRFGANDSLSIWPVENNLDFDLRYLTQLKSRRNRSGSSPSQYYRETIPSGKTFAILGNPNLGEVRGMLLAVQNVKQETTCTEVWFNELRLSKLDERGGWAALGRVDVRLADLGNLSVTGSARSRGFGTLEQRVNERSREDFYQFDVSTNLDLGRLVPKAAALQIPVYAGISKTTSTPEYDPYDLDIKLKDKLRDNPKDRDSIRRDAIDDFTIKTINFTNVKKNKTNNKPSQPWDISNIDLNYSYTHQERVNPIIESEDIRRTRGAIAYNYAPPQRFIEPFKPLIKSQSPWLSLLRDFNFNYKPSLVSVKADVFRQFGALRSRNIGGDGFKLPETYDKYFYFDRYYTMRWDLTRSVTLDFNAINNARVDEPFGRIDTKEEKDSVRKNFFKGGRTTRYHHDITGSYNLPTAKLPFLDWTTLRASYTAKYEWLAASLLAKNLGNTLLTGNTKNVTGEFNFDQLYNKWKFLRAVYTETPAASQPKPKTAVDSAGNKRRVRDPNMLPEVTGVPRFFAKLATSLKRVGVQYTEDLGTLLPGYLDSTQFLGMNFRSEAPGWKYILGYQPDTGQINKLGARGLLTHDPIFNQLIQQRFNQRLGITAQVSPIRDLNIDVTLDKTFDKQYSELFKDTSGSSGLQRFNPYALGSFSISYISYQTLFEKFDPQEISQTFRQFEANRTLLSQRLGKENIYAPDNPNPDGFVPGYGRYAQDVLIPAFIAAYTDKDPFTVDLIKNSNSKLRSNPFSGLKPKPNWNITYNGLSRVKGLEKIFTNVTLRHGYTSTLSMNSFNTALLFQDPFRVGMPYFRDTLTGNYIPYFLIPNVTIAEQFSPLLEVDMTFANDLAARVEYRKSRQLSLSLIDYQLAENQSTEYIIGLNWRRRGVPFLQNVRIGKNAKKLDNDVTFRFDYSMRDDATSNSRLDQNTAYGTAGQKVIRLAPSIDYVVNNRVNLKFYFEQNTIKPKIATTAPVTTTRAGVQVRISLAQ
ncbi:MAG: cell surface protein SprA [Chitinophagaceae bacterium]